jgi:L-aspartate oxidase
VARLIILSAKHRKESRGLHYSTDYPENRGPSRQNTLILRTPEDEFKVMTGFR